MSCKYYDTDAVIGATFILQLRLKDDAGQVLDITGYHVAMAAKSIDKNVLFSADSQGTNPAITLDAETGATIQVQIPESTTPQLADYDVLIEKDGIITPIIRGKIRLLAQITDITP